ncbi:NfeD family protein [Mangrovibacillus cuniculi]|uniref:Membrane protein NfeD2 N-terminal transmembrane domain-containing protein n=1 Tax=Mangrovibacillus cuniculi TaxID=2593652 RepID=A0A7S8HEH5_9BACI|nr:NfeD family protein [Mangrovibacillus cuniculi]QPC45743.1 hypothetical protein G8O30_01530 [Mangrovibacillus cuniculi]
MLEGIALQDWYLYILIAMTGVTVLYLFFGDVAEGAFAGIDWLNPVLIFSFITFTAGSAYIGELLTSFSSILILIGSALASIGITTLLNIFVLIPLSSAEESLVYTEESLKGRIAKVIISIPKDGYGEIVLEGNGGTISKSAQGYENEDIPEGSHVLVIDVEHGVAVVMPYKPI